VIPVIQIITWLLDIREADQTLDPRPMRWLCLIL
jgi:hypothetical protein